MWVKGKAEKERKEGRKGEGRKALFCLP